MLRLLPIALAAVVYSLAPAYVTGQAEGQEWSSVHHKDGVQVFSRAVPGCKIKELRASGRIEATPERVLAVLADVEAYPHFMPMSETVRLLKRDGSQAWYYMVINAPLVARRDYCLRMSLSRLPGGQLQTVWTEADEVCPARQKGLVRMENNHGHWLLTPLDGGRATEAVYQGLSDPDGSVPAWMMNLASARELPDLFVALRRAVAWPGGRSPPPAPL